MGPAIRPDVCSLPTFEAIVKLVCGYLPPSLGWVSLGVTLIPVGAAYMLPCLYCCTGGTLAIWVLCGVGLQEITGWDVLLASQVESIHAGLVPTGVHVSRLGGKKTKWHPSAFWLLEKSSKDLCHFSSCSEISQ